MGKETIRFVDANIFLEVFLKDKNSESAKRLLELVASGEVLAVTSDFIIFTIILQIQEKLKSVERIRSFSDFIGNSKGLKIARFTNSIISVTADLMENYKLDFDDGLQAALMVSLGIKEIISFDKDFDKVSGIKRVEPSQIL